ncbi:BAG domain-containing protein Samui-like isoform X2 [Cylas formicarius]|uniref:BAG domain-containing protein Samui-like isoform X2 n=1 Tax=Cylas formicarius TaxID=197179 RepID=UPI002958B6EC|nr:BAG domain-containing protein Samui-like isoform X2 [Cylas formicarius]
MSAVETIRDIPVIIEHRKPYVEKMATDANHDDRNFPFDRRGRTEGSFRDQLEDLAQRHPQFAEHLQGFPRRHTRDDEEFFKRFERPFGSRFEGFGSPFDREDFDCEPQRYQQQSYPGYYPQEYPQQYQQYSQPPQQETVFYPERRTISTQTEPDSATSIDKEANQPSRAGQTTPIDSNQAQSTGQYANEEIPTEQQRFVSSVNIPVGSPKSEDNAGQAASERVIPIRIEGRADSQTSKSGVPPEKNFGQPQPRPVPEQSANNEGQEQCPEAQQLPQQIQKQVLSPIEQIQLIQQDIAKLLKQVEAFAGVYKDKNYLYLDEMLTRNLLKLDNVDTQGQDSIRSARRDAIKGIERAIGVLEAKATAAVSKCKKVDAQPMETEAVENQELSKVEKEAVQKDTSNISENTDEAKEESTVMDETVALEPHSNKMEVECSPKEENDSKDVADQESASAEVKPKELCDKKDKKKLKKKKEKDDTVNVKNVQ